jgi:hypothetical protein
MEKSKNIRDFQTPPNFPKRTKMTEKKGNLSEFSTQSLGKIH